jgi:hypothetical protein
LLDYNSLRITWDEALTCPKILMRFTADDGAKEHCQFGGLLLSNHRMFEWLDTTLHVNAQ